MIDSQIIQKLLDSELVIADLTGLNPNVFYEIGIRHMTQKPIIHMQLQDEKIPFDTSLYRTLKFSRAKIDEYHRARQELRAMIEQVLAADYKVDNPITRVRGTLRLQEHATPEQRLLLDQVETLRRRLDELESRSPRSAVNEAWKRFEVRAMLEKGANPEKAKSRLREQLGSLVEVISIRANDRELVAEALAPPSRINLIAPAASRVPEVSGVLVSPLDL